MSVTYHVQRFTFYRHSQAGERFAALRAAVADARCCGDAGDYELARERLDRYRASRARLGRCAHCGRRIHAGADVTVIFNVKDTAWTAALHAACLPVSTWRAMLQSVETEYCVDGAAVDAAAFWRAGDIANEEPARNDPRVGMAVQVGGPHPLCGQAGWIVWLYGTLAVVEIEGRRRILPVDLLEPPAASAALD